jgi:hypothetical protein
MLLTSGLGKGTWRLLAAILSLLRLVSSLLYGRQGFFTEAWPFLWPPVVLYGHLDFLWPLDLPNGRPGLRKTQCSK